MQSYTEISCQAQKLLVSAANSETQEIELRNNPTNIQIYINSNSIVENYPRAEAYWLDALEELRKNNLIRAINEKEENFRLTKKGYEVSDNIQKEVLQYLEQLQEFELIQPLDSTREIYRLTEKAEKLLDE